MAGTGAGQVVVRNGSLVVAQGGLLFNFPPGLFWWTGGRWNNAGPDYYTNAGVLNVQALSSPYLAWPLANRGLVRHTGSGALINANALENLAGGTNDFAGDASISGGTFDN
jgi:hypothetical protein